MRQNFFDEFLDFRQESYTVVVEVFMLFISVDRAGDTLFRNGNTILVTVRQKIVAHLFEIA